VLCDVYFKQKREEEYKIKRKKFVSDSFFFSRLRYNNSNEGRDKTNWEEG
jgi:hypothetical protein